MAKRKQNIESNSPIQLTLTNLDKLDKENNSTTEVFLAQGKFKIIINNKFRPSSIQKLIIDLQEAFTTMRSENVDIEDIANALTIYQMLIIKYFTNLPIKHLDMGNKQDLAKLIAVAKQLLDSNLFKEIVEAFDPLEVENVMSILKESNLFSKQLGEMMTTVALNSETERVIL